MHDLWKNLRVWPKKVFGPIIYLHIESQLLLIPQDPIQMSPSLWGFLFFLQAEFIIPSPGL